MKLIFIYDRDIYHVYVPSSYLYAQGVAENNQFFRLEGK